MPLISWNLVVCGINHKTSTLSEREPLQINREEIAEAHAIFLEIGGVRESTIVSTCNRVEFYFVANIRYEPFELVSGFYSKFRNIDVSDIHDRFYVKRNKHAADHLFRVVSGLDSMVLGEDQILGQVKDAYSSACAVKSAGKVIHRLFHQAFRVGKQIRSDTEMGKGACSVSSAAIEMLKSRLDDFDNPIILFIGINQMISLAAASLAKLDFRNFIFANRTTQKAVDFAKKYEADGYGLDQLPSLLARSDIAITCTAANEPIITRETIDAHPESLDKPLLILDMAIPRDTDLETDRDRGLEVLDLETIKEFLKDQQEKRKEAIPGAEMIIGQKLSEFMYWFNHVRMEPLYNGLENAVEEIRRDELSKISDQLSAEQYEAVAKATKRMADKLLQLKIRAASKFTDTK